MKEEIIYGLNPVLEALRGRRRAFELFVAGESGGRRFEKLLTLAKEKGVPVRQRDKRDITRLCGTDYHQGVALRVEPFPYADIADVLARWRASWRRGSGGSTRAISSPTGPCAAVAYQQLQAIAPPEAESPDF